MKIFRSIPRTHSRLGRVVTLGVFDGVHQGHARVLAAVRRHADRLGLPATVITFEDHPHGTLAPQQRPPRLATTAQCLARFQALGMDEVFLIAFTPSLARTSAEDFVRHTLHDRLGLRHLVIGHDFVFGQGGAGDEKQLRRFGKTLGFGVSAVAALKDHGQVISSSRLRDLVATGRVGQAQRWLGWYYTLHGTVEKGEGRGTKIGMPTANLATQHEIIPTTGIYAVLARLAGRDYPALGYIGRKPTFRQGANLGIEIYIPGWQGGHLYGRHLEVAFLEHLRADRVFPNPAALLRQVARDWQKARRFWPPGLVVPEKSLF